MAREAGRAVLIAPSCPCLSIPLTKGLSPMALTVRKKRFIGRMIGHATNPVRVHWRT